MSELLRNRIEESLGYAGSIALSGTAQITSPVGYYIFCIVPSSDMSVSAQGNVAGSVNADLMSIASHPAGVPIFPKLTSITLSGGDGIGYLAKE